MNKKKLIAWLFLLMLYSRFYILDSPPVMAQQVSLSITPPLVEALMKPGKSILIAFTVQNLGDPTSLSPRVVSFTPRGEEGGIVLSDRLDGPARFSLENADFALGDSLFLQTRDSQQILLKIRIPDGAPDGDYYYTLLVDTLAPKGTEGYTSARARAGIGANILVTVTESGRTDVRGRIGSFDIIKGREFKLFGRVFRLFESTAPVPVRLVVANDGDNVIKPRGEITLTGNFGERANFEILPENVLAHSQRLIHATPSAGLADMSTSLVLSGFFIGKYTLGARLHFGEATPTVFAKTQFYGVPFRLIIGLILTLVVTIYLVRRLTRQDLTPVAEDST